MSSPALPFIECEQIHAGLAVSDIPTAVEFYVKKLGFQQRSLGANRRPSPV
jgi:catechol 2,3-dioxygenase-like lactoylglutathione lyase family enzyme